MTKTTKTMACRILLSAVLASFACATAYAEELLERIVAVVNDDVVVLSELQIEATRLYQDVQRVGARVPPEETLVRQALERLIMRKLQMSTAANQGLSVDDETVAQAIGNIAQKNNLTLEELNQALTAEGMSFADFRENLRSEILVSRLRNREVMNRIQVTKAEVDSYLARGGDRPGGRTDFHILHILVATPDGASPQQIDSAKQRTEKYLADINAGADFRTVAQNHSDGRQALRGGDLGWRKADEVPTIFADAVASLPRGSIAGPLRSASGFHIVKLEDYKGSDRAIVAQTKASHILIQTNELTSDTDARQRLERLRSRIVGGDDFATLARSHSDDKASTVKGGDLGWINPGDTLPRFEEEMARLMPGETSQPFKTDFGWHIVQVQDRRQYDVTDEVLRNKARQAIRDRKAKDAMELYLRRLRDEAYVEVRLQDEL
jgi:peptidyl-prolyl cis-trans isomerase SurA